MIPQRNISLISNTLVTAGGRRIPEAAIERDYVLAWFLTGLAGHPLREVLAFKNGTALRRCWFEEYRFSEDLDFTLTGPITLENILAGLNEIFATVETDSGLRIAFDREDRHGHQNSHTFYLRYQGPLPAANDTPAP
jgi:predicted nucleotidyltransferase component of viral defense system